jgi:hypothetical protein
LLDSPTRYLHVQSNLLCGHPFCFWRIIQWILRRSNFITLDTGSYLKRVRDPLGITHIIFIPARFIFINAFNVDCRSNNLHLCKRRQHSRIELGVGSVYTEDDVVKDKMVKVKKAKSHGKQCSTMFCIGQNLYACKYLMI